MREACRKSPFRHCRVSLALLSFFIVPMVQAADEIPLHFRIDELVGAGKPAFEMKAAAPASDAEFLRRVYLDLTGRIPTSAQARSFLDDSSSDKRERLVDRLLDSPEYARRLGTVLDVMLMERRAETLMPAGPWKEYLHESAAENKPWDELVREILAADGVEPTTRPAARFYLGRDGDNNLLTRDISRLFLGRDFQCNQCHDHPLIDDYLQAHYYGIFAFLSRTFVVTDTAKNLSVLAEKAVGDVTYKSVFEPDQMVQKTGPRMPDLPPVTEPTAGADYIVRPEGKNIRPIPTYSRRARLGEEITRAENAPFRQNIGNRLWALLMGRGIVEPVDVTHSGNPPSNPELYRVLGDAIHAMDYDIKAFLRELVLTRTYQRSSELPVEVEDIPPEQFAVAALKPLSPEQLGWSLMQATGLIEADCQQLAAEQSKKDPKFGPFLLRDPAYMESTLFARLDGQVSSFVQTFGSAAGQPEGELSATANQALFLANGSVVRSWLAPRAGNLTDRLLKLSSDDAVAEELYLSVLSRRPTSEERADLLSYLSRRPDEKAGAIQEVAWALVTSSEFRFNH